MKEPLHIAEKKTLAQYEQISTFVYHMLNVATAGGMKEKQAKQFYKQIMDAYCGLKGEAFWLFRDEVIRCLVSSDFTFRESGGVKTIDYGPWGRN
jgi:hypothetical protein